MKKYIYIKKKKVTFKICRVSFKKDTLEKIHLDTGAESKNYYHIPPGKGLQRLVSYSFICMCM